MNILDQAFIGRISIDAYTGVGLVSTCINSLIGVLGSISVSFNIIGSKSLWQNNKEELNKLFSSSIFLSLSIEASIYIIILIFCETILSKFLNLHGLSLIEGSNYLKIYSLSIILNLLIFIYSTVFKIFKDTRNILKVTLLVNIINLFLNYSLVFGKFNFPKLGSQGAGLGTIISLSINLIIYIFLSRKLVKLNLQNLYKKSIEIFTFSITFIIQEFMEDIIFVLSINAVVSSLGVLELSSFILLSQVNSIILMPMFGYSSANLSLISEYYSSQKISECLLISKKQFIY